jgi:phosphatidylglycerophosphate synthase
MFDRLATRLIRPTVDALAAPLAHAGVQANTVSCVGLGLGLGAALLIANGFFALGGVLIVLSRACDALDGAIARQTQATDLGGFLDIVFDFVFYASIPLAFALADPTHNALAAAVLLAAFVGTGSSFLAFAVIAAKRNLDNLTYPSKSFYFLGGLTEGFETLACFIAMCLWPAYFSALAWGFAALCGVTVCTRMAWGVRAFTEHKAI